MSKGKIKPVVNVTSKLWDKLSDEQKREWNIIYREYLMELRQLSAVQDSVKAHNLAFLAVWRGR